MNATAQLSKLLAYWSAERCEELRGELARAELAGEVSELHALSLHAMLAMAEGSELAGDYLEMAEAVAASPHERAVIAEHRALFELLQGAPLAAAERCVGTLSYIGQTEGLWNTLLIALDRLGEVEAVDATLRSIAKLDNRYSARLVKIFISEPALRDVRERPAFASLLNK